MARVLGYVNAILRGKLGGNVFSANRYGEYVRQYVKPINPNTQGQSDARGSFSQALAMWHSLTAEEKQAWQSFADTAFMSKSGINAFMSLRNRAINNQRLVNATTANLPTLLMGNGTVEAGQYTAPTNAPDPALSPPVDLQLDDIGISYSDIEDKYTIDATMFTVGGAAVPESIDDMDQSFGFSCYISNQVAQSSHFINSPELIKAAGVPYSRIEPAETDPQPSTGFQQQFEFNRANYQGFPNEGYARVTVYWESEDGRKFLIGSETCEVPPSVEVLGP